MPDAAATSPTDVATRIAKAVGMTAVFTPNDAHNALVVFTELNGEAKAQAEKPGSMVFIPGTDNSPLKIISVILDGSGSAERILPFAGNISRQEAAEIRVSAPAGTHYLTGAPIQSYINVLVNTMKEQHLQVSGAVVKGDLLEDAAKAAKEKHGMVAVVTTSHGKFKDELFTDNARKALAGVPVLFYTP